MNKLLKILAAGLVSIPLALNAGALPTTAKSDMTPTRPLTDWCYVYYGGTWWQVPC